MGYLGALRLRFATLRANGRGASPSYAQGEREELRQVTLGTNGSRNIDENVERCSWVQDKGNGSTYIVEVDGHAFRLLCKWAVMLPVYRGSGRSIW